MTLAVDLIILSVAALLMLIQLPLKNRAILNSLNISIFGGLISVGFIAYLVTPSLITEVSLLPYYSPHAYNLLIWPAFGLILTGVFPSLMVIPAVVLIYCIDELLWNGLATAYFWGQWNVLGYLFMQNWQIFITVLVTTGAISYLIVRPRFNLNIMWAVLGGFAFLWAWGEGFPVLAATNIGTLSFEQTLYRLCWEVMWQVVILAWAYATIKPRATQELPRIQTPFVG